MRKFLVAAIAVVILAPVAMAETFFGRITSVDVENQKITVAKFGGGKKGDKKKGERPKGGKKKGGKKGGRPQTETVELSIRGAKINLGTFDRKTREFKKTKSLTLAELAERVQPDDKGKGKGKAKGKGKGKGKGFGFRFRGAFAQIVAEDGVASEVNVLDFSRFGKGKGKGKGNK